MHVHDILEFPRKREGSRNICPLISILHRLRDEVGASHTQLFWGAPEMGPAIFQLPESVYGAEKLRSWHTVFEVGWY